MLYYVTLVLIFWALIYTAARFLQYFRIVKNYKEETTAVVTEVRSHEPSGKKERLALDIILSYEIGGEERSSEIIVPSEHAAQYQVGCEVGIRYYMEENGTVHIATAGDAPKKIMFAYLAAIVLEIVIYAVVWRILL
ncbi:MAG: hypothetical protein J6E44_02325 [Lachnospiraceae bacterium]|nr:hypothetical protein [Lachnospiraceae bacterium]